MTVYKKHLSKDSKFKKHLKLEITEPTRTKNLTMSLVSAIISQQLSTKVAQVIKQRFLGLYPKKPTAEMILKTPVSKIKSIGVSQKKAEYIHGVARFLLDNKVTIAKLNKMDDEAVIELLSQIKGIGRWSVEMLLIFGLGREDVFAVDDFGIQKAMIQTYKLEKLTLKELKVEMRKLSEKWSPYRSYACLYLWKSL